MVWEPEEFDDQTIIVIPGEDLWLPDLQVVNSVSDLHGLLRDQKFDFKVHNNGMVWWHPTGNVLTRCEMVVKYFPFDCKFKTTVDPLQPVTLHCAVTAELTLLLNFRSKLPYFARIRCL